MALAFAPPDTQDAVRRLVESCGIDFTRVRARYFQGAFAPTQAYVDWWLRGKRDHILTQIADANRHIAYLTEVIHEEYDNQFIVHQQIQQQRTLIANFQELTRLLNWLMRFPNNVHFYNAVQQLG